MPSQLSEPQDQQMEDPIQQQASIETGPQRIRVVTRQLLLYGWSH